MLTSPWIIPYLFYFIVFIHMVWQILWILVQLWFSLFFKINFYWSVVAFSTVIISSISGVLTVCQVPCDDCPCICHISFSWWSGHRVADWLFKVTGPASDRVRIWSFHVVCLTWEPSLYCIWTSIKNHISERVHFIYHPKINM